MDDSGESCDDKQSVVRELYNAASKQVLRTRGKASKASLSDPFDLSSCLESNSPVCKAGWLVSELGLSENQLDVMRSERYAGLVNLGATCYVNSCIQSLFFNLDFRRLILSLTPAEGSALSAFQVLIGELAYSNTRTVSPLVFLEKFSIKHNLQEDSAEFSTLLLSWLDKQVDGGRVRSLFEGEMERLTECMQCGAVSATRERFLELRLCCDSHDLESLVDIFFKQETVDGYRCSCGVGSAVRLCRLLRVPKYLRLVLGRYKFSVSEGREKISDAISIPLDDIVFPGSSPSKYFCCGILEHHSARASSGHYTASLRDQDGKWWLMDDGSVQEIDLSARGAYLSSAAYIVIYKANDAVDRSDSEENASVREEVERRNEKLREAIAMKRIKREELSREIENRVSFLNKSFSFTDDCFVPVSAAFLRWMSRGDDIRCRFVESTKPAFSPDPCIHGKIDLISVLRGNVKLVPPAYASGLLGFESKPQELCLDCAEEMKDQLKSGMSYFGCLLALAQSQFDSLSSDFISDYAGDLPVWVCKSDLPKVSASLKKWFASDASLKLKMTSSTSHENREEIDITANTVCRHGQSLPLNDPDLILKPKSLVDRICLLSSRMRDDLFWFVPRISARHISSSVSLQVGCAACEEKTAAIKDLELLGSQVSTLKDLALGQRYFALPSEYIVRVKKRLDGSLKTCLRPPKMNTILCPHLDLKVDILPFLRENAMNSAPFCLVSEKEMQVIQKNFDLPNDLLLPVVEKDLTFTVSVCPLLCPQCQGDNTLSDERSRIRGLTLRVFHETVSRLDSPNKALRVNLDQTTLLYRPGRSRLVGIVPEVDQTAACIDLKLLLIDLGIMDQSPFPGNPDEAIGRIQIYITHPVIRGALVLIKDESSIQATLAQLGAENDAVDTVFIEFIKSSPDDTPKRRKTLPLASDSDAGLRGSILRD